MIDKSEDLNEAAKKSARIVTVIYVIVRQTIYMSNANSGLSDWLLRTTFSAVMVTLVFYVTGSRMSNRKKAFLTPLSSILPEILWAALLGGDWIIYLFLIGCTLLSLLYLDVYGLMFTMLFSNTSLAFCSFVLKIPMSRPRVEAVDGISGFAGIILIDILLIFIGYYSVGASTRFRRTGRAFNTFMDTTPNFMAVINERARIEYISQSLARWFGISHAQYAEDRALLDLCRSGGMKVVFQEVMERGGNVEKNFELTIDGKKNWYMLRSSPMAGGNVARTFEFADITPIMEAKNTAEEAARAKSSFLANMSHEIRTPMNAIMGMTELVMLGPLNPEQTSQMVAIKGASMSLLSIINDILDFSKIDADKMEIIEKPFDIASLINDTVNIINIKAGENIAFTAQISKDIPPQINSDELRIKQVLLNVLNNAVKFTREGGVSLDVSCEYIAEGLKLNFSVTDTGIGINKEETGKLFEAFAQLDTRKNRNITGTGLGLAITKRLIELMDGNISVDSVYGKGTTFSFYILAKGAHSGHLAKLTEPEAYSAICFEPSKYNGKALESMFTDLGVRHAICRELSTFKEALDKERYTHIFFDKSILPFMKDIKGEIGDSFPVIMKEIQDTAINATFAAVNRPILITGLSRALSGEMSGSDLPAWQTGEIKLGEFYTAGVLALLVDDNPVNLMVTEGMLRQYGIRVVTAMDGSDGVDKIQKNDFDIVFMDHMMPVMDGIDATKAIRILGGRYETLPIIALTANAISGMETQFEEAGMDGFLSKPIVIKHLHHTLYKYLPPEKIIINSIYG